MKTPKHPTFHKLTAATVIVSLLSPASFVPVYAAPLTLSQVPLFVTTAAKANVLLILDNSNSMDEDPSGAAAPCDASANCGSASDLSKSEIARTVAKNIVSTYTNKINLGLMAYQQNTMSQYYLHNSPYDVSYNPTNYNAAFAGARDSATKKYRMANPASAGNYIHYNVALPFYAASNQGNSFCYSPTAKAFNNGENATTGPWDYYRCFGSKTGTADGVVSPLPSGGIKSSETTLGYSGTPSTAAFSPTDSDFAQGILDFGKQVTSHYVGLTWYVNASPGRGYLHVPVSLLDSTQAGKINTKLGRSQFTNNKPTDPAYALQNAGLTPIEGTFLTAKDYFQGSLTATNQGGPNSAPPNSCGKNFTVLITDGLPSTDQNGATVSNATTAINAAATAATLLKDAGVKTYVVGFSLPYGTDPRTLDKIASSGGTDIAYSATDYASLNTTLSDIFSDILAQTGSAASVATNSTALNTDTAIYQAKFDSASWSGQLLRYNITGAGAISATPAWLAGSAPDPAPNYYVALPAHGSRNIITYKPSVGSGVPFRWPANPATPAATELDSSQTTALGSANILNYLRGDASNEGTGATNYRMRSTGKLGDIVNSTPVYVGKPSGGYPDNFEASAYADFRGTNANRTAMLYLGANDGMVHGFDAATGTEKLAYVPSMLYSSLPQLSSKTYSHRYYVDGSPTVADVYFSNAWHTVLVGGLNGGGQGIYALDVTSPGAFAEATAANIVLWEFGDKDNTATVNVTDGDADLGFTYSQPAVARMKNGKWAAIFGNGYNNTTADGSASTTGSAVLYIVDIQNGNLLAKIDTKTGSAATPNGLASPAVVDVNGDNVADYIYAGDLQGNMWKFDVTSATASGWKAAYGTAAAPSPLYTAKDAAGTAQPITERPEVSLHPTIADTYMVYFGTGKYIETGDNGTSGTQTQTFYGIWDNNAAIATSRTDLQQQRIVEERTQSGSDWRMTSANSISCWGIAGSCKTGWYMDLYNTYGSATANYGEKQVSNPIYRNGRIIFTTLTPSAAACSGGGFSWLMELDPTDGSQLDYTPFDVNKDGVYTTGDLVTGGSFGTDSRAVSGTKLGDGITGTPTLINQTNEKQGKYMSQSTGDLKKVEEKTGARAGRISWRELRD